MNKLERINKYLSESGVCSRREVDELIETGRVEVNRQPARIGMQIDTENDKVYVDGQLVDPENKIKNAISLEALQSQMERPWWEEHNEMKQAKEDALKQNPKSKLLRHGRKNATKTSTSVKKAPVRKTLSELKEEASRVAAIKTRGHSAADKQAKNELLQAANKEVAAKVAKRDELRRPKTLGEMMGNMSNTQRDRTLKERRVEGVNPKASQLRGKKTWSGSSRRTRHK
jgi:ribosomal 50S subunit-recycling heat shock protein